MSSDSSSHLSQDVVFEILSSRRRRMALYLLRQNGGDSTVNELAELIAALENDVDVDELTSQQQKRVYVSLYQTHLPKLEQTGIIEYDAEAGEVRLTDRASEVDSYLTRRTESSYPWEYHYGTLAILSATVMALWVLSVPLVSAVPFVWIAAASVFAFAVSGVVHYLHARRLSGNAPAELEQHG